MYKDRKGNTCEKPSDRVPKKRESAYGIFIKDEKILLVKPNSTDKWEFPGGGKESNEDLIQALKREFTEETGLKIINFEETPIHKIKTDFYADDIDEYFESTMHFFIINETAPQNEIPIDTYEISESQNIPIQNLNKQNMNSYNLEVIRLIQKKQTPFTNL